MSDLTSKYQKLALEYAKLKAQNHVLKKGVVEEKENATQLQVNLQRSDQIVRRLQQEIDSSSFRSLQMAKRVQLLQDELEKSARTKSKTNEGSVSRNLSHAIDEDLKNKIEENENLHKKVYEADKKTQQLKESLTSELSAAKELNVSLQGSLDSFQRSSLQDLEQLRNEKSALEEKLIKSEQCLVTTKEEFESRHKDISLSNSHLQSMVDGLKRVFTNSVVFNDSGTTEHNLTKVLPFSKRDQLKSDSLLGQTENLLSSLFTCLSNFHKHSWKRCLLYPIDSSIQPVTTANRQLITYLKQYGDYLNPLITSIKDDLQTYAYPFKLETMNGLKHFSMLFTCYTTFLTKLSPYYITSLKEECDLSVCAPNLQQKNTEYLHLFQRVLPAMSKLEVYLSVVTNRTGALKIQTPNTKSAFGKLTSALNELHLTFKDMSKTFNIKMVLEYQLPTTTKSEELRLSNELLLSALLTTSNICAKLAGFLVENLDFFILDNVDVPLSPFNLLETHKRAALFLSSTAVSSPPTVPYANALENQYQCSNNDKQELFQQLETNANKLHVLEQEKEHWLLETQLLKMKLEKQTEKLSDDSSRQRVLSISHVPSDTSMLGSIQVNGNETMDISTEDLIKQHMGARMAENGLRIKSAEAKSMHFESESNALHKHLNLLYKKKDAVQQDLDKSVQSVSQLQDELAVTRKSYEEQLSLMSEHLAAMNDKLAAQKDEINTLKNLKSRKK
uniref:Protein phosphatase 1 regulatory subunit 21 n=1 Tax=Phallusia mammillata TaxID=59560 RepID=A0A6F9DQC3_9ASCI|nr:protein phosphatase 1 regulatory subunit 21-like [Phallusia mammillata]